MFFQKAFNQHAHSCPCLFTPVPVNRAVLAKGFSKFLGNGDQFIIFMNEKELVVIEATAEGIKKARETEVPE